MPDVPDHRIDVENDDDHASESDHGARLDAYDSSDSDSSDHGDDDDECTGDEDCPCEGCRNFICYCELGEGDYGCTCTDWQPETEEQRNQLLAELECVRAVRRYISP